MHEAPCSHLLGSCGEKRFAEISQERWKKFGKKAGGCKETVNSAAKRQQKIRKSITNFLKQNGNLMQNYFPTRGSHFLAQDSL